MTFDAMSKIHIGVKIRDEINNSSFTITDFAKKINLTRDGVYKIFGKKTLSTDQLEKISEVLNHDFFQYYKPEINNQKQLLETTMIYEIKKLREVVSELSNKVEILISANRHYTDSNKKV
jgi:transcriptional regulator with XRE-family HTH domain